MGMAKDSKSTGSKVEALLLWLIIVCDECKDDQLFQHAPATLALRGNCWETTF